MQSVRPLAIVLAVGLNAMICSAQIPQQFNYQGRLTSGTNLVNAYTTMVFRLYNTSVGGSALYIETQTVAVVDGLYSAGVGQNPGFGSLPAAATNQPLYLELQIGPTTLSPREQVISVLYAVKAAGVTNGAITTAMLSDAAVTGPKIAGGSVSNAHLATGSIRSNKIDWTQMPAGLQDGDNDTVLSSYDENGSFSATPQASGTDAIAQGSGNRSAGNYSVVGGGQNNTNLSNHAMVGGGDRNLIGSGSQQSVINGGVGNTIEDGIWRGTIGGGWENRIQAGATDSTIAGGSKNTVQSGAGNAMIGGGGGNIVSGQYSTVSGGYGNKATAFGASVSGGISNRATAAGASVGGGGPNENKSAYAFIGGGQLNGIGERATNATIAGGVGNRVGDSAAAAGVAGGAYNMIGSDSTGASIGGGQANTIGDEADRATIAGGVSNTIADYADCSMIAGGANNYIGSDADWSFAAGRRAKANHSGSFVWADGSGIDFGSSDNNQFLVRASGGVGIGTTNPTPGTVTVKGDLIVLNGDLVITNSDGAYRGNIGPNKGAPFPRPAYDSGWVLIDPGNTPTTLVHNVGGNVDNYVLDLQREDPAYGINNVADGGEWDTGGDLYGYWYMNLTTTNVEVQIGGNDPDIPAYLRVRIWVYN